MCAKFQLPLIPNLCSQKLFWYWGGGICVCVLGFGCLGFCLWFLLTGDFCFGLFFKLN